MASHDLGSVVTELRRGDTHLQWRPKGTDNWIDLIPLQELVGSNIELRQNPYDNTELQWRIKGLIPEDDWKHLFDLSDLKGDSGPIGQPGVNASIHGLTYDTHIVYEPSRVEVTMTGPDTNKHFHFDFYLEDVSHAINNHDQDPYAHPKTQAWVQEEIAKAGSALEWTGGVLYLKKPNGDIASFVDIVSSDVTITGFWKCPTPTI